MNLGTRSVYQTLEKLDSLPDPYDMNITGGDIIFMCVFGTLYFILLFVVEFLGNKSKVAQLFSKENNCSYEAKKYDNDV